MVVQGQGRGKKSEVEQLREQLQGMQMQIDELKRARQATRADTKGYCSDTERGAAVNGFLEKQRETAHRRDRSRRAPSESDDDDMLPGWIKNEQPAQTGSQLAPEPIPSLDRKRPLDTSQPPDPSDSEFVGLVHSGRQRKRARYATEPTKSKRVRLGSESDEPDDDHGAAKASSTSREKSSAEFAHNKSLGSRSADKTPLKPKAARPAPKYKPQRGKLPEPNWRIPPSEPSTKFKLPTSSLKLNAMLEANVDKQQKGSAKAGPSQDEDTNTFKRSYAATMPFEFKLVVSYSDDSMHYHQSTDLENDMKSFWSTLKRLRKGWEEAAGAEWAWELQKPSKARNGRLCVSTTLAKRSTRWREGDSGDYACRNCSMNASLCFTWVKDEDAQPDQEDEAAVPRPKGEFWCLPVHHVDSRCKTTKGREIRTWLNEGDNSESDSSGEGIGASSEEDDFKVESDLDQSFGSATSSEDDGSENHGDDEL